MGVNLEEISKYIGTRLDLLLGADILLKYRVLLDLPNNLIQFSLPDRPGRGSHVALRMLAGVPIAACLANGKEIQAVFDTGSQFCYVHKSLIQGQVSIGKEKDFYPGLGEFETDMYQVPFNIGGNAVNLRCGVLPAMLESALGVTGAHGILGVELMQKFSIWLNLHDREMILRKVA